MKRILFASPYTSPVGGITSWAQTVLDYYSKNGTDDCSLTLMPMDRVPFTENLASKWSRVRLGFRDYWRFIQMQKELLRKGSYDVFHFISTGSIGFLKDLLMIKECQKRGVRSVIHFHYGRVPEVLQKGGWEAKLMKQVLKKADETILIDIFSFNALREEGYENIDYIPNPLSPKTLDTIQQLKSQIPERIPRTILFIGQCWPVKGLFELIEACKNLTEIKLKIVGTIAPDMRQNLMDRADHADWLEIVGEVPNQRVIEEMLKCDVFVLPSRTEGFPIVMLESMACGCAIVASSVGAIPSILENTDGKNYGILTEPRNVKELAAGLQKMLDDKAFKEECRKNVQVRVQERYYMPIIWKKMLEVWNR